MLDKTSGFLGLAKRELPQVQIVHCFLHRHALASVLRNIKFVLDRVVQAVNFIRPKPLNHRLFRVLCTETGVQRYQDKFPTDMCPTATCPTDIFPMDTCPNK